MNSPLARRRHQVESFTEVILAGQANGSPTNKRLDPAPRLLSKALWAGLGAPRSVL